MVKVVAVHAAVQYWIHIQWPSGLWQNLTILLRGPSDLLAYCSRVPCLHGNVERAAQVTSPALPGAMKKWRSRDVILYTRSHLREYFQLAQILHGGTPLSYGPKKSISNLVELWKNVSLIKCTSLPLLPNVLLLRRRKWKVLRFLFAVLCVPSCAPLVVLLFCLCSFVCASTHLALYVGCLVHVCTEWYATLSIRSCVYTCVHSIVAFCSVE